MFFEVENRTLFTKGKTTESYETQNKLAHCDFFQLQFNTATLNKLELCFLEVVLRKKKLKTDMLYTYYGEP